MDESAAGLGCFKDILYRLYWAFDDQLHPHGTCAWNAVFNRLTLCWAFALNIANLCWSHPAAKCMASRNKYLSRRLPTQLWERLRSGDGLMPVPRRWTNSWRSRTTTKLDCLFLLYDSLHISSTD